MIVRMHRSLAAEWRTRELATAVRDHFVHIHVELGSAARHPNVQREHVMVLAGEDFVASLNDQFVLLIAEPLAFMVSYGCGLLQSCIGGDHFSWNQIFANAEMFQ